MDSSALNKELNMNIISPLYLFIVDDDYIANSYITLMKKKIGEEFIQLNQNYFEAKKTNPGEVIAACNTLPVLSDKRLVVVRDKNIFHHAALCGALIEYIKNPCQSTALIVYTNECDKRVSLYKSFLEHGKIVLFEKLKNEALEQWIKNAFNKRGLKIGRDALHYMIEAGDYNHKESEVDIGYYANEIEKLSLYEPTKKEISLESVKKAFSVNINEDIFKLSDAIIDGDISAAHKQIYKLTYNKTAPQVIIAAIARAVRNICICQSLYEKGKSEVSIAKECGLHPYVVKKSIAVKNRFNVSDGLKSLLVLAKIDVMLKTGLIDADSSLSLLACDIGTKTFLTIRDTL